MTVILAFAVGLAIVYALLGVVASTIQETVTGWLSVRASSLDARLRSLLADDDSEPNLRYGILKTISCLLFRSSPPAASASDLFKAVMKTGIITSASGGSVPSYIKTETFSQALSEALSMMGRAASGQSTLMRIEAGISALPPGRSSNALRALMSQANGDLDSFKKNISTWFDESMDRLNGIYTRWSKAYSLVFGLIVAVCFNVNSIEIGNALLHASPEVQAEILKTGEELKQKDTASTTEVTATMSKLHIPVGRQGTMPSLFTNEFWDWLIPAGHWAVLGWILTAIATSFGSHFWFEAIGKILDLRTTGPKPDTADKGA